ncbi:MAG: PAS sensor histidine kinase, partial [uncultured archaeon A07HR67]
GFDFYHPEDAPRVADAFGRLVEEGEPYDLELRIVTADDRVRWVRTVGEPRIGEADEATTVVGVFQDITERKRRERELDQLRERLDLAVTGANLGVWDWDMTTDEVTFNDRWATMLGLSPDEIDPHLDTWETRVHPADLPRVETQLEAHIAGETEMYDCEHRMRTAAGEWTWIRDTGKIVEYDAEGAPKRAVGIHLDIDAQKRQEAALERARNELRQVIDLVPDLIFAKDADGRYLLANEATADAYGLTVAETEGTLESEIIPDGDQSVHFRADDKQVLDSDEPVEIPEEKLTTADGETRLLQTTKIPYTVAGTDQDAVLGYARDVTPLRQYESQLEEQRDSLTVLNQIVRHDIRNALQVITGSAELLADRLDGEETRLVDAIQLSAAEAIEITTSAREVTDLLVRTELDPSPVPLTPVLTQQIEAVRSSDRPVRVVRTGESDEQPVLADDMLDSVFRNLLGNAVAHTDADVPSIRVATTAFSDRIRVSVADNGPGVPDEKKDSIFEEGICGLDSDGTGLGLYLVRTLVERYDGAVWVDDAEDGGARFTVELPRADAETPATDR